MNALRNIRQKEALYILINKIMIQDIKKIEAKLIQIEYLQHKGVKQGIILSNLKYIASKLVECTKGTQYQNSSIRASIKANKANEDFYKIHDKLYNLCRRITKDLRQCNSG